MFVCDFYMEISTILEAQRSSIIIFITSNLTSPILCKAEHTKVRLQILYAYDYVAYKSNLKQSFGVSSVDSNQDAIIPRYRESSNDTTTYGKRAGISSSSFDWAPAELSAPPGVDFLGDTDYTVPGATESDAHYTYYYDDSAGAGQYIYVLDAAIDTSHGVRLPVVYFQMFSKVTFANRLLCPHYAGVL